MSELRAATISNLAGTGPVDLTGQYAAKAWVNFDGTGTVTIRESGNVSSITDNATSSYTVNFANAMPDANYALTSSAGPISNKPEFFCTGTSPATTSCPVGSGGIINTYITADKAIIGLAFFR